MARRIHIAPHHTLEELQLLYKKERDAARARHLQVVLLALKGHNSPRICEVVGMRRDWVFVLIKRYNEKGLGGLGDGRRSNGGHGRVLTQEQEDQLMDLVAAGPHPDGGPWTSRKVAVWMTEASGRPVDQKLAWVYLRRLGFSLQRPLRRHAKADMEAQEAFKKGGYAKRS